MKLKLFLATLVLAFAACTSLPLSTFNDKAAAADETVQLVQTSSTALLRAGKLTVAQDQAIQANVKLAHDSIVAAKKLQASDPAAADAELTAANANLSTLKSKTGVTP
jgi:hypothetical protein